MFFWTIKEATACVMASVVHLGERTLIGLRVALAMVRALYGDLGPRTTAATASMGWSPLQTRAPASPMLASVRDRWTEAGPSARLGAPA
jgi:hypothetical protein